MRFDAPHAVVLSGRDARPIFEAGPVLGAALLSLLLGTWILSVHQGTQAASAARAESGLLPSASPGPSALRKSLPVPRLAPRGEQR